MNTYLQYATLAHLCISLFTMGRAQGGSLWLILVCGLCALWTTFVSTRALRPLLQGSGVRTAILAAIVAGSVLRAISASDVMTPGVDLLLVLLLERCLLREQLREQLQLLLLSSILMVIAGVIHVGADYPVLLALFVLVATVMLSFWNLQREAERIGARAQYALTTKARHFTLHLSGQSLRLGLGILACALAVFVFFPRIGAGVFFRGQRVEKAQAGFRDEVKLGHQGDIQDNPKVIARVFPENPGMRQPPSLPIYFRVSAFDRYRDGAWSHAKTQEPIKLRKSMHRYFLPASPGAKTRYNYLRQNAKHKLALNQVSGWSRSTQVMKLKILQEDLGAPLLMLPEQSAVIEWLPRGALERRVKLVAGEDGQIRALGPLAGSMQFRAYARRVRPSEQELAAQGRPSYGPALSPYLEHPQALAPTLDAFAAKALAHASNTSSQLASVQALIKSLAHFEYSTTHPQASPQFRDKDPIETFLLDTKSGHCEYFASALALLARSQAIPARVVNGYYGAHRNPVDGTYQITQSQAHAWVEIYFGQLGWVSFDATPPSERPPAPRTTSLLAQLRSLYQALETKYLEYVVDYDGKKQWQALKGLRRSSTHLSQRHLSIALGLLGGAALLFFSRRRGLRRRGDAGKIERAQARLLAKLQRRGFEVRAQENALSWARRAQDAGHGAHMDLLGAVKRSEALRFSPEPLTRQAVDETLQELSQLVDAV